MGRALAYDWPASHLPLSLFPSPILFGLDSNFTGKWQKLIGTAPALPLRCSVQTPIYFVFRRAQCLLLPVALTNGRQRKKCADDMQRKIIYYSTGNHTRAICDKREIFDKLVRVSSSSYLRMDESFHHFLRFLILRAHSSTHDTEYPAIIHALRYILFTIHFQE
ncbi:hypothetical protein CEXT_448251 [Caerostris extrusa]|uniref:Uncharacterized protein n=1 Tax=Caerostris extrusa TaxID=172846 RepID=A0AAV4QRK9_CAEEX|nr:hypothetical protein CEXT_448251 [Caerostris extrusa]